MKDRARTLASHPGTFAVGLILMAGLGAIAIAQATRLGPGMGSDSAVYVAGTQSLLKGEGLRWEMGGGESRPSTHPPLYSAVLVPFEASGIGWQTGARVLGAALFSATIAGTGVAARRMTGSAAVGLVAALLVLTTPDLIVSYSWAMTEGLYLALTILLILLSLQYLEEPSWLRVTAIGLTTCLLYLTKFGGVSVILAVAILLLVGPGLSRRERWRHLLAYAAVVIPPFLLWGWVNTGNTGALFRPLAVNPIDGSQVRSGAAVLIAWMLPQDRVPEVLNPVRTVFLLAIVAVAAMAAVAIVAAAWRRSRQPGKVAEAARWRWIVPAALAGSYFAVHAFSVLLTLPQPDTGTRTLLPLYLPIVLLGCWAISLVWSTASKSIRAIVLVLAVVFLGGRVMASLSAIREFADQGAGYTAWKSAGVIAVLQATPGDIVYTDDEGPVFLLAGRYARSIPFKWSREQDTVRPSYPAELERMRSQLRTGALLVLFYPAPRMRELPSYDEITEGMVEIFADARGRIYVWQELEAEDASDA